MFEWSTPGEYVWAGSAVYVIVAPFALHHRPLHSPRISNNLQNTYCSVQAMYIRRVVAHSHATQYQLAYGFCHGPCYGISQDVGRASTDHACLPSVSSWSRLFAKRDATYEDNATRSHLFVAYFV